MSKKLFTTSIGEFVTSQAEEIKKEDIARAVNEIMEDYKKYDKLNADIEVSIKTLPNDNGFRITYKSPTLKKKLYVPVIFAPQVAQLRTLIGMRFKDIFGDFGLQGFDPDSIVTMGPSSEIPTSQSNAGYIKDTLYELLDLVETDIVPGKKISDRVYDKLNRLITDVLHAYVSNDCDDDEEDLTEEKMEAMPYTDYVENMHELIAEAADLAVEEMNKEHTGEQL